MLALKQLANQLIINLSFHSVNADSVASWRFGQLHFFEQPLGDVITKLKPYLDINVHISSADVAKIKGIRCGKY